MALWPVALWPVSLKPQLFLLVIKQGLIKKEKTSLLVSLTPLPWACSPLKLGTCFPGFSIQ